MTVRSRLVSASYCSAKLKIEKIDGYVIDRHWISETVTSPFEHRCASVDHQGYIILNTLLVDVFDVIKGDHP